MRPLAVSIIAKVLNVAKEYLEWDISHWLTRHSVPGAVTRHVYAKRQTWIRIAPHVTKFFPLFDVYYSLLSKPTIDVSPYQLRPLAVSIIAKVLNVAKEYLEWDISHWLTWHAVLRAVTRHVYAKRQTWIRIAPHVTKFFPLFDVYYSLLSKPKIDVSRHFFPNGLFWALHLYLLLWFPSSQANFPLYLKHSEHLAQPGQAIQPEHASTLF